LQGLDRHLEVCSKREGLDVATRLDLTLCIQPETGRQLGDAAGLGGQILGVDAHPLNRVRRRRRHGSILEAQRDVFAMKLADGQLPGSRGILLRGRDNAQGRGLHKVDAAVSSAPDQQPAATTGHFIDHHFALREIEPSSLDRSSVALDPRLSLQAPRRIELGRSATLAGELSHAQIKPFDTRVERFAMRLVQPAQHAARHLQLTQ
jgi:hypothetical protein